MRTVNAARYVTPLREGGSLPAIIEADDDGMYVLKFRGAGQGIKALIAELIAGELARAAGFLVPELVFVNLDPEIAKTEPDPEIQDLIRASGGLNLGLDYLPGSVMFNPVSPGYFRTLQIALKAGRIFTQADGEKAPKVAVINETMAKKLWPDESAEGKFFTLKQSSGDSHLQVVGIVQNSRYKSVVDEPESFFYVPMEQMYMEFRTVHVRTTVRPETLAPHIEAEIRRLAPGVSATQVQTMGEALNGLNGFFFFRFGAQLSGTMGLLGLILAVVGVYSVVSYAASQRTHEIGIRMALGADPADILKMMLGRSLAVIGTGVAVGLLVALGATRTIASLLVGISPSDPLTFAAVVLLLSTVALLACWIPARRATRVSPLVALRYE